MSRTIELSETQEKGLLLYTIDRVNGDHPVGEADLQESFELIIKKSLEAVIEEKYRNASREKTIEEKAAEIA